MCRLLGWTTRVPTTLSDLLGADDLAGFTELSTKHGDGWGVARSTRRRVAVRKRAGRRPDQRRVRPLGRPAAAPTWAWCTCAGRRWGSASARTTPTPSPTAGWRSRTTARSARRRRWTGCCRTGPRRRRRGRPTASATSSPWPSCSGTARAPEEALRTTADEIAATMAFTSLNCLLLTPEKLYAFCRYDPAGRWEDDDPEYYDLRYRVTPDAVVVASSGWGRRLAGAGQRRPARRPPPDAGDDGRDQRGAQRPRLTGPGVVAAARPARGWSRTAASRRSRRGHQRQRGVAGTGRAPPGGARPAPAGAVRRGPRAGRAS